jgi:hypothetical protein
MRNVRARRPSATVRVLSLPQLGERAVRVEVDCPSSTTGYTWAPVEGRLDVPQPMLVTMACYTHEERCGDCDTSEAHRQGDQRARDYVERLWSAMQAERARAYAEGRRN